MSVHDFKPNVTPTGVTGLAGAAPQTGAGNTISIASPEGNGATVEVGSLSARVYAMATTNLLTITARWQVSDNGSTWYTAIESNNAAETVLVTGTGVAVTATKAISAPDAVYGYKYARCVVVTGVGVGGGAGVDEYSISYNYRTDRRW